PHTASWPMNKGDTLWVGIAPYPDSCVITGTQTYAWPIIVLNNALLRFQNADATIHGNLIAMMHGKIQADHSTLHFPQQYFYQRTITLANDAVFHANNDTLDYGGFVHTASITDSAQLAFYNVYQTDFMTTGVSMHATLSNTKTNIAGEYIMTDYAKLSFSHCHELLLWHSCPDTSVINWSFPKGDTVKHYLFNNLQTGVKGVGYQVQVDTSHYVMWGLMPTYSSQVTISNSSIRTIGLWFELNTTVNVSGLANRSFYTNYTAPISDRTLKLINDSVMTWSLYTFSKANVNVSNSTVGEIGSYGSSHVNGLTYSVDGSGGYHYGSDTSAVLANGLFATCNVRSEHSAIFALINSNMYSGTASAIGNSVLIVMQSNLTQDPVPYDGSCAWLGNIEQVADNYVDSITNISGSAWINRTAVSALMDFKSYQLLYQHQGSTSWTPIQVPVTNRISHSLLGTWNTHGLTPGNYSIGLKVKDTWGDSAMAVKNITLLPWVMGITEQTAWANELTLFPNPAGDECEFSFSLSKGQYTEIKLIDLSGKECLTILSETYCTAGLHHYLIPLGQLSEGLYFCQIKGESGSLNCKLIHLQK
ncbi:MAG TPA: T9SS type A sorting domain-containing protein, partial [Bacteroidia bacterium]|nr:T9SS type A sorting domain-containing protein [Bacteroidia bacterium]